MGRLGYFAKDAFLLLSESKHQEQQLKLKRRWLMGLPSKPYERWSKDPKFLQKYGSLPESLLREDDVYYETIKTRVEESFGASNSEKEYNFSQDNVQLLDTCNLTRMLISCIDSLTNKGLYRIAMIFTGGSVMFEKTRSQMKRVIREFLSSYCRNRNLHCQEKNLKQLSELLNNPKNFRENYLSFFTPKLQSNQTIVVRVLDTLEDLPTEALLVMHMKVRGVQGCMPKLLHSTINQSRGNLIDRLRKNIKKMLSKLGKGDELQEPLVKAMAVAVLAQKLKPGYQSSSVMEFYQFSPEIKSLQNEIVKAIWLIKTKVRKSELKTLQRLLDPNTDVSNIRLRKAITKMLIWYLFQSTDMNTIPKSLLEALAVVNRPLCRTPYRCFPIEEIEQEVECVLSISAQTKQIVLDFLPEHEFDQDFADAYMEELEESDDDDYDDDDAKADNNCWQHQSSRFPFVESDYKLDGIGESMPVDSRQPVSASWENGSSAHLTPNNGVNRNSVGKIEPQDFTIADSNPHSTTLSLQFPESRFLHGRVNMDPNQGQVENTGIVCSSRSVDLFSSNLSEDKKKIPDKEITFRNQYLAIQEVCDETSMVAYDLIGHMLEKLAQEDEIDLDGNNSSYLRGNSSNPEYAQGEKHTSSDDEMGSSVIVPVVERMPSFPKSVIEKLKMLIDS